MNREFNFVGEVAAWNIERDNLRYIQQLEYDMLQEELDELDEAIERGTIIDQADALGDLAVVAIGGLTKLCGGDIGKVQDILLAITAANNTKSSTKNADGKITKPKDFTGPEKMIGRILNDSQ